MDPVNPSAAVAAALVRALSDLGVRHAVLCPGSRSAPLAYALADADRAGLIHLHVRIDERSAGFLALGLAKEQLVPAAVVTTSGTAVANLHPAVLEASHAGVPLVVLTADRPHEVRGTGANQTTDQVKVFGGAVRMFAEIPAADDRPGQARIWRNVVARAVTAAVGTLSRHPGPAHVNVAFREPLVPDEAPGLAEVEQPVDAAGATVVPVAAEPPATALAAGPRTVVLAGDDAGPVAWTLAERVGWPLLAEPSSGARLAGAVGPYRLLLDHHRLGAGIERVVMLGRPTLARSVTGLLSRSDVELVVVSSRPDWPDPTAHADRVVEAVDARPDHNGRSWLDRWRRAGAAAAAAVDEVLDAEAAAGLLTGPLVAREVAATLPSGAALVVGSSNPIRDLDLTARPRDALRTVLAGRGLAGIDGTVSTASGVALARAERGDDSVVRCLLGDLTFLHDAGGLLVGPGERRPDLQVIVVDDVGGGIFGLLEHGTWATRGATEADTFERVFATPHTADVAALCAGYGVAYELAQDLDDLRKSLAEASPGTTVVHVPIARHGQAELAGRLRAAALAAVDAAVGEE